MADDETKPNTEGEKPAVTFKTEGEYLASVERKAKGLVAKAREAERAELLGKLGIESLDDLDEKVLAKLKTSDAAISEVEKHKGAADKATKEHAKAQRQIADLTTRLQGMAKRDALMPFANQVRDTEALSLFVSPHLDVSDDGTVTGKDGKSVEDIVKGVLTAKEYLKSPDFKPGTGTKPNAAKTNVPFTVSGDAKLSVGQLLVNELVGTGAIPGAGAGGP